MIRQHVRYIFKTLGVTILLAITVTSCSPQSYRVQPGDTLALIAAEHGTSVEKLVELNQDQYPSLAENPGLIETGWELQLPGGSSGNSSRDSVSAWPYPTLEPTATVEVKTLSREEAELEIVRLVNEERVKAGLPALEIDPGLMQLARSRSEDMAARGYFSHYDPETGEYLAGNTRENIVRGDRLSQSEAERSVSWWMDSDGHRANILYENVRYTGVGIAVEPNTKWEIIITQVFK